MQDSIACREECPAGNDKYNTKPAHVKNIYFQAISSVSQLAAVEITA